MAAHSFLTIGETGVAVGLARESYSEAYAALFLDAEDDGTGRYSSDAKTIRERLHLFGYSSAQSARTVQLGWPERLYATDETMAIAPEDLVGDFVVQLGGAVEGPFQIHTAAGQKLQDGWGYIWGEEQRQLQFLVDRLPDQTPVVLDLSEIIDRGYTPGSTTRCADARAQQATEAAVAMPTIILTEGSTDKLILETALHLLRPDLVDFVSFLDYSQKPDGGAGAVANAVKAFAAARVGNRVIALFDNDTAGRQAINSLPKEPLPPNMQAAALPVLDLARSYPTYGPDGEAEADVNGRAVSIELFLGRDVLTFEDGLAPIQWTSYINSMDSYQGEVTRKKEIQERYREKVARSSGPDGVAGDWEDLRLLINYLVQI